VLGALAHLEVSNTIEEGGGDMSNVRDTSGIEEVEDGYGDNEENKPEPENGQDGDQVSALVQAYILQEEITQIIL